MSKPLKEDYIIRIKSRIEQHVKEPVEQEEKEEFVELMTRGQFVQKGGSIHHAQIGHRQLCRFCSRVGAGHGAAGRHDALYIFREQECHVLTGILQDGLRAAAAIGHAAGIAKIDDLLVGQALAQLPHTGQAAKAAVEYADRAVIHAAFPSFPAPARSAGR